MAVKVAILGASGYAGIELARLVVSHPELELVVATAETFAGARLAELAPLAPDVPLVASSSVDFAAVDLVFSCLPHGTSASLVGVAVAAGARVVDLSADFRLASVDHYEHSSGAPHPAPHLLPAPYGLPELGRTNLDGARVVANPGCYATATLLAIAPLIGHLDATAPIVVNALSGASGAGRAAQIRTLFCEIAENVTPYRLGRTHHHVAEIEAELASRGLAAGRLVFNPHLVPTVRGLLATVTLRVDDVVAARQRLVESFTDEPLVVVLPDGEPATFAHVVRTPRAVIGTTAVDARTLVVTSALDNLLKGAASQAIQNANRLLGLPETTGLLAADLVGAAR